MKREYLELSFSWRIYISYSIEHVELDIVLAFTIRHKITDIGGVLVPFVLLTENTETAGILIRNSCYARFRIRIWIYITFSFVMENKYLKMFICSVRYLRIVEELYYDARYRMMIMLMQDIIEKGIQALFLHYEDCVYDSELKTTAIISCRSQDIQGSGILQDSGAHWLKTIYSSSY